MITKENIINDLKNNLITNDDIMDILYGTVVKNTPPLNNCSEVLNKKTPTLEEKKLMKLYIERVYDKIDEVIRCNDVKRVVKNLLQNEILLLEQQIEKMKNELTKCEKNNTEKCQEVIKRLEECKKEKKDIEQQLEMDKRQLAGCMNDLKREKEKCVKQQEDMNSELEINRQQLEECKKEKKDIEQQLNEAKQQIEINRQQLIERTNDVEREKMKNQKLSSNLEIIRQKLEECKKKRKQDVILQTQQIDLYHKRFNESEVLEKKNIEEREKNKKEIEELKQQLEREKKNSHECVQELEEIKNKHQEEITEFNNLAAKYLFECAKDIEKIKDKNQEEITELNRQLEQIKKDKEKCEQEKILLEKTNEEILSKIREEKKNIEIDLENVGKKIADMNSKLIMIQEKNTHLENANKELQRQNEEQQNSLNKCLEEKETLKKTIEEFNETLSKSEELYKIRSEFDKNQRELKKQYDENVRKMQNELKKKYDENLRKLQEQYIKESKEQPEQIAELQRRLERQTEQIRENEQLKATIKKLEIELDLANKRILNFEGTSEQQLKTENAKLRIQVPGLTANNQELHKQISELTGKINNFEETRKTWREIINEKNKIIDDLNGKNKQLITENSELRKENNEINIKKRELENEIETYKNKIITLERTIIELKKELTNYDGRYRSGGNYPNIQNPYAAISILEAIDVNMKVDNPYDEWINRLSNSTNVNTLRKKIFNDAITNHYTEEKIKYFIDLVKESEILKDIEKIKPKQIKKKYFITNPFEALKQLKRENFLVGGNLYGENAILPTHFGIQFGGDEKDTSPFYDLIKSIFEELKLNLKKSGFKLKEKDLIKIEKMLEDINGGEKYYLKQMKELVGFTKNIKTSGATSNNVTIDVDFMKKLNEIITENDEKQIKVITPLNKMFNKVNKFKKEVDNFSETTISRFFVNL